jgi:hypothetical protein
MTSKSLMTSSVLMKDIFGDVRQHESRPNNSRMAGRILVKFVINFSHLRLIQNVPIFNFSQLETAT